jgi:hypothetical protein
MELDRDGERCTPQEDALLTHGRSTGSRGAISSHLYVLDGNRYWIILDPHSDFVGTTWECSTCADQERIEHRFGSLDEAITAVLLTIDTHHQKVHGSATNGKG